MASTSLTRTVSSTGNTFKGTLSAWIKRSEISTEQYIFENYETSGNRFFVRFLSTGQLGMETLQGGSTVMQINTLGVFRDTSAWYHIVIGIDSTLATASDRVKVYINGVQQTSYNDETQPPQNQNMSINEGNPTYVTVGRKYGASNYFDGIMSHVHWIDGTQYAASDFGSTDSTTGQWKINVSPSVTYGTNGFFVLKDGNSTTDQSGQSNNLSSSGTLTSTKDCPSNVYTTWNNLNRATSAAIQANGIGNGNTYLATVAQNDNYSFASTLAFPGTGKFYMEFKVGNIGTDYAVGIGEVEAMLPSLQSSNPFKYCNNAKGWAYTKSGNKETGGSGSSYGNSFTSYDYIGLAYNNGALWFSKNGTWQNNATISEINAGTTTYAAFTGIDTSAQYFIMFAGYNDAMIEMNAGNGAFRGTQAGSNNPSSGDTGALFKYTVPTGYQPLSTKGLNS